MTIPLAACGDIERNVYVFNTGNCQHNRGGYGNCRSSIFGGNNFWKSVGIGAAATITLGIVDWLFTGPKQKFDGWFSSAGNWASGIDFSGWGANLGSWGGGLDLGTGNLFGSFDFTMANSPLGCAFFGLENTKKETEAYKAKVEKYKTVINNALEAAGLKDEGKDIMKQFYKDLVNKCDAIKTANTNITDAELQTHIENFARARNHDSELVSNFNGTNKTDMTVCAIDEVKETYNKLGQGYVDLFDANTDGKVDVHEFVKYEIQGVKSSEKEAAKEAATTMFKVIDTNNDDKLDAKELAAYNYLTATYADEEGATATAEEISTEDFEKFGDASAELVGNTAKQAAMQERLKKAAEALT